jgi:hypothetical protein
MGGHLYLFSVGIYIEGAGAGGRALLFRCTNLDAVQKIGKSGAGYLHASAIGNDMFAAQLIKR